MAGCGVTSEAGQSFAVASIGPGRTVSPAINATRAELVRALGQHNLVLSDTQVAGPARRVAAAVRRRPRAVYQVILPKDPTHGYIVVYEFPDSARAAAAAAEEQAYLATGPGRVQTPQGTVTVIRQLGTSVILYSWLPGPRPTIRPRASSRRSKPVGVTAWARAGREPLTRRSSGRLDRQRRVRRPTHSRIAARLILRVWVRGKSSSGHNRHAAIRWFAPSVPLAALTAASRWALSTAGSCSVADASARGSPAVTADARTTASIRPGSVSTTTASRTPAMRSAFSMSSG